MYLADRPRRDRRLPPAAHPSLVPGPEAARVHLRGPRLDGRPGPGDELGGRPPQAPRARRRGGRSAQPTRRPRRRRVGRAARPLARAHGLAVLDPGPRQRPPLRQGPLRGPGHADHQPPVPAARAAQPRHPRASPAGLSPARSPAPPPACSGAGSCASSSCTTSPGASTRCATSSARAASRPTTTPPTSPGSRCPRFGEAWHHNHHAFPRSACHGLRRWERLLDPSAFVIAMLEKVGLARNVVRIAPERQLQREHESGPGRARPGARTSEVTGAIGR